MSEENLFVWSATIFGPPETPWEGGVYSLRLTFNDQYPEKPPRVRFTAEMFHPNVYTDGTLCLDIIQDKWSPIYTGRQTATPELPHSFSSSLSNSLFSNDLLVFS